MEKDLQDLLIDELHDILSAEEQIIDALPAMVKAAASPELKTAFESHLKETKGQVKRLEKIFKLLKVQRKEKLCKAAKGLIQECKEVLKDFKTKSQIRDAALISKAQRIEHYEISAYGTMRTFAHEIEHDQVAALLQETLDEEENADKKLSKIAEGGMFRPGINAQANLPKEERHVAPSKKASSPIKARPTISKTKPAASKSKSSIAKRKPALAKR
jgi:ferritin-like metal-binding protein YciE